MYFRNDAADTDLCPFEKRHLNQVDNDMPLNQRANDHRMENGYVGKDGLCVGACDADADEHGGDDGRWR